MLDLKQDGFVVRLPELLQPGAAHRQQLLSGRGECLLDAALSRLVSELPQSLVSAWTTASVIAARPIMSPAVSRVRGSALPGRSIASTSLVSRPSVIRAAGEAYCGFPPRSRMSVSRSVTAAAQEVSTVR